jgi:hypothetical protein
MHSAELLLSFTRGTFHQAGSKIFPDNIRTSETVMVHFSMFFSSELGYKVELPI